MKIRTDFVTNSSANSNAEIEIDNLVILEILQRYKDLGVFGDAKYTFQIGNVYETSKSKTPAFYLSESEYGEGNGTVFDTPKSLEEVLANLILVMDAEENWDIYYNKNLYAELKEELRQREGEINDAYLEVSWNYENRTDTRGYPDETKWEFTYDPDNGEKYTVGFGYRLWEDEEPDYKKVEYVENDLSHEEDLQQGNTPLQPTWIEFTEDEKGIYNNKSVIGEFKNLEEQIAYHLENHHLLHIPQTHIPLLVSICVEAIINVNNSDAQKEIPLPKVISWSTSDGVKNTTIPAYTVVSLYLLERWINSE